LFIPLEYAVKEVEYIVVLDVVCTILKGTLQVSILFVRDNHYIKQ